MKILFVEASSGHVVGGSLTGMVQLIRGLDPARYQSTVVLYEDKPVVRELRGCGVTVHLFNKRRLPKEHRLQDNSVYLRVKVRRGVGGALRVLRAAINFVFETVPTAVRLLGILRREAPDIVHVCNGYRANLDAILAARLCGVPCVVHSKGFDKHSFVERRFARGVAASIFMTKAIEEHCHSQGIRPPVGHVIYDGLDLGAFRAVRSRAEVRRELGIDEDLWVAGVVGNIQEWKGQLVLLEAIARLADSHPRSLALIVGGVHRSGADYYERLRTFVDDQGLQQRVLFTGPREDVADLMRCMDVVVHCSVRAEPFGRVIIEGMSVGRPVIAARAGGVPEFVRDGYDGLLVEPGNVNELATVLRRLFDDVGLREDLSRNSRQTAEDFSIEKQAVRVAAVYDEVARRYHMNRGTGGESLDQSAYPRS